MQDVIAGYERDAGALIPRYEAIAPQEVLAPVLHLVPEPPGRILDLGAGSGRDAAWFAAQGHRVLAVEPVAAFRAARQAQHGSPEISWLDDRLPGLERLRARRQRFDMVLVSAVWQYLDRPARKTALTHIRGLIAAGGHLVLSLRHGPGATARPVFATSVEETTNLARQNGLQPVCQVPAQSRQAGNRAAGISWTWLGFRAP